MNNSSPNLFNALFRFNPREGHTPKENFLSEAFAHVLATCDAACDAWLSLVMCRQVSAMERQVTTRETEHDEDAVAVFPDMRIRGVLKDGEQFDLASEHKWDSPCNPNQIKRYLKLVNRSGDRRRLTFICASYRQKREAVDCDARMKGKAFLWEDIFRQFNLIQNKSDLLVQFLDFMKAHGLSPAEPIKLDTMVAFLKSFEFLTSLEHSANKLNDEFDWDFFPERYRKTREVTNRWGRIAIEFLTPAWKPTITVGFLYNERDHGVSFVNREKGIDLLLRIETGQEEQKNIAPALAELRRKQKKLLHSLAASALLLREPGNENEHSLLIVRSCLADVIEKAVSQEEQLEAIYKCVQRWSETLFGDGALEAAFKEAGLDSGQ